jgi:hypothetical protein
VWTGVLIYDELDPSLIARYNTTNFHFVRADISALPARLSPAEWRFWAMYDFIAQRHDLDMVVVTDISDVVFNHNPLPFFRDHPTKVCSSGAVFYNC